MKRSLSYLFARVLAGLFLALSSLMSAQDTMEANWTGILDGSEVGGVEVPAGCALTGFDISLDIVASGNNWAGDMAMAITAPNGNRIELGGYNMNFGYVDIGGWPADWNSNVDGNFTASFTELDQYNLSGSGCWLIEFMNAWSNAGPSEYFATVTLIGFATKVTFPAAQTLARSTTILVPWPTMAHVPIQCSRPHWVGPRVVAFRKPSTSTIRAVATYKDGLGRLNRGRQRPPSHPRLPWFGPPQEPTLWPLP